MTLHFFSFVEKWQFHNMKLLQRKNLSVLQKHNVQTLALNMSKGGTLTVSYIYNQSHFHTLQPWTFWGFFREAEITQQRFMSKSEHLIE